MIMKKNIKYFIFAIIIIIFAYNYIASDGLRLLPFDINLSDTTGQILSICFLIFILISYIAFILKSIRTKKYNNLVLSFIIFLLSLSYLALCFLFLKSIFG